MKKLIMMLLMMGFSFSQGLPQPAIVGEDIDWPTLKISQFVKVDESIGVTDNRVTLGIKQLVEESFQDTRYRLVEDDNADFTANVEVLYIGKPNEAFSSRIEGSIGRWIGINGVTVCVHRTSRIRQCCSREA